MAISLGSAFLFFGFCFLNLASKVYDFFTGYGAAYDMNFLEYVLLISGTFLAGFASVACLFATLVILS